MGVPTFHITNMKRFRCTKNEDNRPDTFEFTLGNVEHSDVINFKAYDEIVFERENGGTTWKFRGVLEKFDYTALNRELRVSGRGIEQILTRYYTCSHPSASSGRLEYASETVDDIITDLLRGTDVTIGSIDTTYSTATASFKFDFKNIYEAVYEVADPYGAKFWVDENRKLYFKTARGSNKGVWFRAREDDSGNNVRLVRRETDYTDLTNKITVLGKGDGISQLRGTYEDTRSQGYYGIREGVDVSRNIADQNVLDEKAEKLVDIYSKPREAFTYETDFNPKIDVGDTIRINDDIAYIKGNYKVIKYEYAKDETGEEKLRLELSNRAGRFETLNLWQALQQMEKEARGSTSVIYTLNSGTNIGTIETDFYVPKELTDFSGLDYIQQIYFGFQFTDGTQTTDAYLDGTNYSTAWGGQWTTGQDEIDITDYCEKGWHTLKLTFGASTSVKKWIVVKQYVHAR